MIALLDTPPNSPDDLALTGDPGDSSAEQVAALTRDLDLATQEVVKVRSLLSNLEKWAQASEEWARSAEARLQQTIEERDEARDRVLSAEREVKLMKRSRSWLLTAPLRGFRMSVKDDESGARGLKAFARPVLTAGLVAVRHNPALRRAVESVLKRSPALRDRLRAYADARPASSEGDA